MPTQTNYDLAISSFPNGKVDVISFRAEIEAVDSGVVTQLATHPKVTTINDAIFCRVTFKGQLSSEEFTALGALANAHTGESASGPDEVKLTNAKTTPDNRLQVISQAYPLSHATLFWCRGDDPDLGDGGRGKGPRLVCKVVPDDIPAEETSVVVSVKWQYVDDAYIWGGELWAHNGRFEDYIDMEVCAPFDETLLTPADPVGSGNCVLVPSGLGNNVIVPHPTGTHNFDLATPLTPALASKILGTPKFVSKASPVPAYDQDTADDSRTPTGFWNMDPVTGVWSPAIGPLGEPLGFYNFFDSEMKLQNWVNSMPIADPNKRGIQWEQDVPSAAAAVLPHWIFHAKFHIHEPVDPDGVQCSFLVNMAREIPI